MERNAADGRAASEADLAVRRALFELAGDGLLPSLLAASEVAFGSNRRISIRRSDSVIRSLEAHRLIAEAVAAGDERGARVAMATILAGNERDLKVMTGRGDR